MTDGTIEAVYEDADNVQLILLKPKFEERIPKPIYFVASTHNASLYQNAVAIFSKR